MHNLVLFVQNKIMLGLSAMAPFGLDDLSASCEPCLLHLLLAMLNIAGLEFNFNRWTWWRGTTKFSIVQDIANGVLISRVFFAYKYC